MGKIIIMLMSVCLGQIYAQQTIAASGGNASGSGGNISYTIGQIFYLSKGNNNEVSEGVQQSYEISALGTPESGIVENNISLYPNPVKDVLFVDFNQESFGNSSYQLFNSQGQMIRQGTLNQKKNELDFRLLPQSLYVIKIIQENQNVKSFKIIKK